MLALVTRHEQAKAARDYAALEKTFHPGAICEIKPAGIRIACVNTLTEMYRRMFPKLLTSYQKRRAAREWSNQNGLVREWLYPVKLPSKEAQFTRNLEIFEFADGLGAINTYRVRMNTIYSALFLQALGEDFLSLPGVEKMPG